MVKPVSMEEYKSMRKGCILKLMKLWLGLGAIIILLMIIVRSCATTDPAEVRQKLAEWVQFEAPEGFEPYRRNYFLGVTAISFWDQEHVHEDGRSKAVISFLRDKKWQDFDEETFLSSRLEFIQGSMDKTEFKVRAESTEQINTTKNLSSTVYIFSGLQKMDDTMAEALTCYRFFKTKAGYIQVQTLGFQEVFPLEKQIEALKRVE